jgi:hypothetical protein
MRNFRARGITKDGKPIFRESLEHENVAQWLAFNGVFFIHVPNEVLPMRGTREAFISALRQRKRMGVTPGVADFLIFDRPPAKPKKLGAVLELKALDGAIPTPDQRKFLIEMDLRGYETTWQRGYDAAVKWLKSLGYERHP